MTIFKKIELNQPTVLLLIIILISFGLRFWSMLSNELLVEEAYYWNYAQHLDWSYLDHPPMVALLIYAGNLLGQTEFCLRLGVLLCGFISMFYTYKLSELMYPKTGLYALVLLAILPYFFIEGLILTPDQPLIACWSASLFFLYRALVLKSTPDWLYSGIAIGLGLISKYTIALLGLSTIVFMLIDRQSRKDFIKPWPYLCALISILIFSPVIYWNAQHEWISFWFQSGRRLSASYHFGLVAFFALLFGLLTPLGTLHFYALLKIKMTTQTNQRAILFLKVFTFVPLAIFGLFSLSHVVKLTWLGPALLAVIPWLANQIYLQQNWPKSIHIKKTAAVLLIGYAVLIASITDVNQHFINQFVLNKFISWKDLSLKTNVIATQWQTQHKEKLTVVPLDLYYTASELIYYQKKLYQQHDIAKIYEVYGRHIYGLDSLMYRFWQEKSLKNQTILMISFQKSDFDYQQITQFIKPLSTVKSVKINNQGGKIAVKPLYYQFVRYA